MISVLRVSWSEHLQLSHEHQSLLVHLSVDGMTLGMEMVADLSLPLGSECLVYLRRATLAIADLYVRHIIALSISVCCTVGIYTVFPPIATLANPSTRRVELDMSVRSNVQHPPLNMLSRS